jgi:hypothetical protein
VTYAFALSGNSIELENGGRMNILRLLWAKWRVYGQIIGDMIARVILSLFYFTLFMPFGIGVSLFGDPLDMKRGKATRWLERSTGDRTVEEMRRLA